MFSDVSLSVNVFFENVEIIFLHIISTDNGFLNFFDDSGWLYDLFQNVFLGNHWVAIVQERIEHLQIRYEMWSTSWMEE
jgi:hypothetical protein